MFLVLRIPDSAQVDSPITRRATELKNYNDLITTDPKLQNEIVDKYISGSKKPVDLNIDYTKFENYVNFSSAEKRLKNFKYKIQQIDHIRRKVHLWPELQTQEKIYLI